MYSIYRHNTYVYVYKRIHLLTVTFEYSKLKSNTYVHNSEQNTKYIIVLIGWYSQTHRCGKAE